MNDPEDSALQDGIEYRNSPPVDNAALNALFESAWEGHTPRDFAPVLARSMVYICAFSGERLVGFINLAWDGGIHAFLLDTTVDAQWQHRGIGRQLVLRAVEAARQHGIEWLHVDYEPHLETFYQSCGFQPTLAGLLRVKH